MMKKIGLLVFVVSVMVSPAMALLAPGLTEQTWDFAQGGSQFELKLSQLDNRYGTPVAFINDLSGGQGVQWDNGAWQGPEFKIILDIPNQPIANPEKILTITLTYRGDVSFLWIADIDTGDLFHEVPGSLSEELDLTSGWITRKQQWFFKPNPREEIVAIGLKGATGALAAIDSITIETWCVPEPATMVIFGLGAALVLRLRKKA